jgi:hypothetical protein
MAVKTVAAREASFTLYGLLQQLAPADSSVG